MKFPKRQCALVIAFLSITIAARVSVFTKPVRNERDPPFWQSMLREFIFKTISSDRYQHDDLYKKLLDAPFYGGPLPIGLKGENAIVSRGNAFNMPDGQWIFCQEGCTQCELCDQQRDDPAVKWTLRRVERSTRRGLPKWNLRLTVAPRMYERFRVNKHPQRYDDVHVMNEVKVGAESARELAPSTTQQEFTFEKSQKINIWSPTEEERYSDIDSLNEKTHDDYRRGPTRIKRYRSKRRSPLVYHDPDQYDNEVESPAERQEDDTRPRLIVGIDQHGKKHLVHLIPVDSPLRDSDQRNHYDRNYRKSDTRRNTMRIGRTIQEEQDASSYETLIERILDSFNTHRNFVEKFLSSDRIKSVNHNDADIPLYSTYSESGENTFEGRNWVGYRIDDSRQANQYLTDMEYQVKEQGEQFRHYPNMTREVNKPYGEYQDQNTMIEYEPYGVSAGGQQHHQDEQYLPPADVERRRRNSFAKLMDSTAGHQASRQNHTQIDASDTEFWIKRDFLQNSTNQPFTDSPLKINRTDERSLNLSDESATLEKQTLNSDN